MKAIAEYFRDLAAEDRYFGAEPPQPDTEMLHKIAEREIQRRVEAKIQKNGILLRPSEAQSETLPATQPEGAPPTPPFATAAPPASPPLAQRSIPVAHPDAAPEDSLPHDPVSESVAAKLQRIRAAVAQARATQAPEAEAEPKVDLEPEFEPEPEAPLAAQPAPETDDQPDPAAGGDDFGFALDISGPLSDEETADIAAPDAEKDAKTQAVTEEPLVAEYAPEQDVAEVEAPPEDAARDEDTIETEEDAVDADDLSDAEAAAALLQAKRQRRRAARIAQAEEEQRAQEPQLPTETAEAEKAPEAVAAETAVADAEPESRETHMEDNAERPEDAAQALDPADFSDEDDALETAPAPAPTRPAIRARVIKLRRAEPVTPALPVTETETTDAMVEDEAAPDAGDTQDDSQDESEAVLAAIAAQLENPDPAPDADPAPVAEDDADDALMAELAALTADLPDDDDWGNLAAVRPDYVAPQDHAAPEAAAAQDDLDQDDLAADIAQGDAEAQETLAQPENASPATAETPAKELSAEERADWLNAETFGASAPAEATKAAAEDFEADPSEAEEDFADEFGDSPEAVAQALPVDQDPAEAEAPKTAAETTAEAAPDQNADPAPRAPRPPASRAAPEGDLSRLLEKTDAQMAGTENRRRISAIAHLKAAVAATVADRRAGTDTQPGTDGTEAYRADLSQAVRPRRPVSSGQAGRGRETTPTPATARPEARPAPLVLVSEQRVDQTPAEDEMKAQAVRPRRVIAASLHRESAEGHAAEEHHDSDAPLSADEATSFAQFAESRAPQGLGELLEAAAAYTAQIEGRPHFSPPQIMRKVTAMGDETFSREDRLRVFGTLLRQGKIAKVKRGQYAITEASRFYQRRA
ncbi:hypothetical protein CKO11_13730 [Rhodobacter sp. TJ_12]|uniref:hypothetical protein n=1 Tax=Rhodobacter sp. TJ_12 TaxID=2029399 RepID=UPI001CBC2F60|nr:hypothetical protein [Rhodobacter sp. TJ_12]MBZ4023517.1 hypothetical protein [Rhodobacter sp. TJ_12]